MAAQHGPVGMAGGPVGLLEHARDGQVIVDLSTGGLTTMHISHGRSGQPSEQRTATFTGTVHLDPVMTAPGVMINTVIFTPGACTYWHRHPGGQLLVVTAGRGVVATPGPGPGHHRRRRHLGRAGRGALARRLR